MSVPQPVGYYHIEEAGLEPPTGRPSGAATPPRLSRKGTCPSAGPPPQLVVLQDHPVPSQPRRPLQHGPSRGFAYGSSDPVHRVVDRHRRVPDGRELDIGDFADSFGHRRTPYGSSG